MLITLELSSHERRFRDVLVSWSPFGVKLLSVQRIKNVAGSYPDTTRSLLSNFALFAQEELGDLRWKNLSVGAEAGALSDRSKPWAVEPALDHDSALMLRLRRGIGVNMRADVLSLLLAIRGEAVPVRRLADALKYTEAATRRAAEDLAAA